MRKGGDLVKNWPGFSLIHHNLPGESQKLHSHAEHQVFVPLSGRMTFTDDFGFKYKVNKEGMFFIPALAMHSFESSVEQGERVIAMISPRLWEKSVGSTPPKMVPVPSNQLVKELVFFLLTYEKTKSSQHLIQSLTSAIGELVDSPLFHSDW